MNALFQCARPMILLLFSDRYFTSGLHDPPNTSLSGALGNRSAKTPRAVHCGQLVGACIM